VAFFSPNVRKCKLGDQAADAIYAQQKRIERKGERPTYTKTTNRTFFEMTAESNGAEKEYHNLRPPGTNRPIDRSIIGICTTRLAAPINTIDVSTGHQAFLSALGFGAQVRFAERGALPLDEDDECGADEEGSDEEGQVDGDGVVVE
jgi:hypothetical protein